LIYLRTKSDAAARAQTREKWEAAVLVDFAAKLKNILKQYLKVCDEDQIKVSIHIYYWWLFLYVDLFLADLSNIYIICECDLLFDKRAKNTE